MQWLGGLLGSINKERVLSYLVARESGHASEIARWFDTAYSPVLRALESLETAGVLSSRSVGKTRVYEIRRSFPAKSELEALVRRSLSAWPPEAVQSLCDPRRRPRRKGKPIRSS